MTDVVEVLTAALGSVTGGTSIDDRLKMAFDPLGILNPGKVFQTTS